MQKEYVFGLISVAIMAMAGMHLATALWHFLWMFFELLSDPWATDLEKHQAVLFTPMLNTSIWVCAGLLLEAIYRALRVWASPLNILFWTYFRFMK